jgi:hypothetical protein
MENMDKIGASIGCCGGLAVVTSFAGIICCVVYLSIALDNEPSSSDVCPAHVRDWTIGFLVLFCFSLASAVFQSKTDKESNDGGTACISTIVSIGCFAMAIATPIIIDKDLREVCPDTKYEKAFEVVFFFYVVADVLIAVILLGICGIFCAKKHYVLENVLPTGRV